MRPSQRRSVASASRARSPAASTPSSARTKSGATSDRSSAWIARMSSAVAAVQRLEPREDAPHAAGPAEVHAEIRRARARRPVVRRGEHAAGRVDGGRQLVEGDPAVPVVRVAPARHRSPAVRGVAARHAAAEAVADRAVHVGAHEVVAGGDPVAQRLVELGGAAARRASRRPRRRSSRRRRATSRRARRRHPARAAEHDRPVPGLDDLDLDRRAAAHRHRFAAPLGARQLVRPEPLDEQILVVGHPVRDRPGDVRVVAEVREARHPCERQADRVEARAAQVVLPVHVGQVERAVRIAGEERLARRGAAARQHPVVAAAVAARQRGQRLEVRARAPRRAAPLRGARRPAAPSASRRRPGRRAAPRRARGRARAAPRRARACARAAP